MNDELEPAHPRRAAAGQADRVRLPRHRAGRFAEGQPGSRDFSVEMETGTGKTYVYLRTALELYQRYGFRKFIMVVPSVAIREGVLKTLRITRDLFTVTQLVDPLRKPSSRSVAQSWNSVYN